MGINTRNEGGRHMCYAVSCMRESTGVEGAAVDCEVALGAPPLPGVCRRVAPFKGQKLRSVVVFRRGH